MLRLYKLHFLYIKSETMAKVPANYRKADGKGVKVIL